MTIRLTVAAVGRFGRKDTALRALYDQYAGRITYPLTLREVEEKRPITGPERAKREGELLLGAIPDGALVVALDEGGRALKSAELAGLLGDWQDRGVRDAAFVIGGAGGLADAVRKRADLRLSLGPMTWPHLMVRGLLAEQLYRAQCILGGHPYHRE